MNIQQRLDLILPSVTRPGRYTGGEWNSVRKEWDRVSIRMALAYPDTYEVGMSNLGLAILYDILNRQEDVLCERVYAPWLDMETAMRREGVALYTLESKRPVADFDIVGFSLQYELNYSNVLNMLDLAGIPLLAEERDESHPLIIGGGSCAYNPEPLAQFFDAFVLGEGEEVVLEVIETYREWSAAGREKRQELLRRLAGVDGVYVPALYAVRYREDGAVAAVEPLHQDVPARITKRIVARLPPPPTRLVVPYLEVVHDRAAVEIQRGCTQGCRFCQAGVIYRPMRQRPLEEVLAAVDDILSATGYEEVALVSLSSSDYPGLEKLVETLMQRYRERGLAVALPSLRIDSFSVQLARLIQERRKTGLTFAPEAGSQRLRDVINKGVTEDDLLRTVEAAFSNGWQRIKLYFMIGLPTETPDDVEAIAHLVHAVRDIGRQHQGRRTRVNVSVATFVPKPHTPFQWLPLADGESLEQKQALLRRCIRGPGLHLSWHEPHTTMLEALLSRGDRRLGPVIHRAWQLGARFDAWSETFDQSRWQRALSEAGLDPAWYLYRQRPLDEVLPWDHLDVGVTKRFLIEEYERSLHGQVVPDCRERCLHCGILTAFKAQREKVNGRWGCP